MKAKYDKIGTGYNATRKADSYLTERLFHYLNPQPDGLYLDIGCGTGNYTHAIQSKGFDFIGIDPSEKMLNIARLKNVKIDWQIGKAEKTDLENLSIDGIMASLTIHHWLDLNKAFMEMYRVLKNDRHIVIFTSTPKQMKGYWLNHYFPKMLEDSVKQMPSLKNVKNALISAGFSIHGIEIYSIKSDLQDLFLYSGKNNPELYFEDEVRSGISSFSSLSNRKEVKLGLAEMKLDIENRKIKDVIKSYENDYGDYLFIIGKKEIKN